MAPSNLVTASSSSAWFDLVDRFRRRRATMVVTALAVIAAFVPFVVALPDLYRASAKVLVEGRTAEALVDGGATPSSVDTRLEAIKQEALSRANLSQIADRFHLYADHGPVSAEMLSLLMQRDIRVDVVDSMTGNGQPTAVAFSLSYVARDPATAAAVVNTIASFYVAQNDRIQARETSRTAQVLSGQLSSADARVRETQGRVRSFTLANMGALPQETDVNLAALERLDAELRMNGDEQAKLMERRQTLQNQIADLADRPTPADASSDPVVRLAQLKKQKADLLTRWTAVAPDVKVVQDQIDALERQIAAGTATGRASGGDPSPRKALDTSITETNAQLQKLQGDAQTLRKNIASYEQRVATAPSRGPELDALNRDYQSARDTYDAVLKKYNDASLAENAQQAATEQFRVLDQAIPPTLPAGPNRTRLFVLGALLAVVLACAVVILVDRFDTSFHSMDDLRAFTRVPVLVSIPKIQTLGDRLRARARMVAAAVTTVLVLAGLGIVAFQVGRFGEVVVRTLLRVG